MANLIIEHKDGRRYGTTTEGFEKLRETEYAGFKIVGEETEADFLVTGVPQPVRRAGARRKTSKVSRSAVVKPVVPAEPEPAASEPEAPAE